MTTMTTTTMTAIMPPSDSEKEPSSGPFAPALLSPPGEPSRLPIVPGATGTSAGAVIPGISSSCASCVGVSSSESLMIVSDASWASVRVYRARDVRSGRSEKVYEEEDGIVDVDALVNRRVKSIKTR